jgi:hypothetical protein
MARSSVRLSLPFVYSLFVHITHIRKIINPTWHQNYSYDRRGNRGLAGESGETILVDDKTPAWAALGYDGGDRWNWRG